MHPPIWHVRLQGANNMRPLSWGEGEGNGKDPKISIVNCEKTSQDLPSFVLNIVYGLLIFASFIIFVRHFLVFPKIGSS